MSRSAIAGLIVGGLMLGALFLVERHFWPGFSTRSHLAMGLVLAMAIYGALLTALCFRRLIDPWLPTPILAWILMWIWWVFEFILDLMRPAPDVIIVEEVIIYDDDGGAHEDGMGYGWAIFMMLIGIGMYAGGIALTRYMAKHAHYYVPPSNKVKHRLDSEPRPEPPRESPHRDDLGKPEPKPESPKTKTTPSKPTKSIEDAKDLAAAIAIALPSMSDERNEVTVGTRELARWASKKLSWKDVAVATNETSLALAEKDPPKAFGKRLCESGTLDKIEKQGLWGVELHTARMTTKSGDMLEMLVAGNTGTLVKRNQTKFCGVVTQRLDKGKPATLAVGMFETAK